ncbi:MAG: hypothetical protein FWG18_03655, partial [Alphaproteobacteria bacterium]|nr:hypothetical protein [Alphaproteobacteria bacterium]
DLDFNFDFENMDFTEMFNLDMFGFGNNQSFANMRGTTLYNAAKNRCKNVLNDCKAQGANTTQITARYDMEIDRDCIAFEQGLERMNNTLRTNVRAAKGMLEQARLAVLNNQNTYDAKQCVGALENCMTDDMVCGDSYIKCMDPTKSYIDENGQIVLGRDIVTIRKYMTNFNAAEINLSNARASMMNDNFCSAAGNDGRCIVRFLLEKIGEGPTATSGLCRAVLDRCRRVSYTEDGRTYKTDNDVVKNYIQRAMINIKAGQERVIAEFASTCMQDVAYCYSQQVSQVTAWSSNAAVASIQMIMRSACRNIALTCGFAIFSEPDDGIKCRLTNGTTVPDECINQVSEIFYQSMLCPENSTYMPEVLNASTAPTPGLYNSQYGRYWVNARCLCDASYGYDAGRCMSCPNNSTFTPVPTPPFPPTSQCPSKNTDVSQGCPIIGCKCAANHMSKNGQCVKITE